LYCSTLWFYGKFYPVIQIFVYDTRHMGLMLPKIAVIWLKYKHNLCDLLTININKSKLITVKIAIIFWVSAQSNILVFIPTFRRNVLSWFQYDLICGCKNVFGYIWRFDVVRPQTFITETLSFCHQFTIHLHRFSHSEDGVSVFLGSAGTSKESCVLQKPKEGLLFEQHTPCRLEDLLRMCNLLSSCMKINTMSII
jgi:hypothetical protein